MHFVVDRIEGNVTQADTAVINVWWGSDDWVGRHVEKDFGESHDKFTGLVFGVDDWKDNPGKRIFKVVYTDGDSEWLDAPSVQAILQSTDQVVRQCRGYTGNKCCCRSTASNDHINFMIDHRKQVLL